MPLLAAGLDLPGRDISARAISQLRRRAKSLVSDGFEEILPPRLDSAPRVPPGRGQWSRWEAIWQRRPVAA